RSRGLLAVAVATFAASCAGTGALPTTRPGIPVTVLTSPGCAATEPAIERLRSVAARLDVDLNLERVTVETAADASRLHLLGSPTILVDQRDLDPSARDRKDFGLG